MSARAAPRLSSKPCRAALAASPVTMARSWDFRLGQHAYLYMPSISYWQSHPFSVAWSEEAETLEGDKLPMDRQDVLSMRQTKMSFVIRGRTGFTDNLYNKAAACQDGRMTTRCFVEGPYGGMRLMHSCGTVMLFAGGVGITQCVPHVRGPRSRVWQRHRGDSQDCPRMGDPEPRAP